MVFSPHCVAVRLTRVERRMPREVTTSGLMFSWLNWSSLRDLKAKKSNLSLFGTS